MKTMIFLMAFCHLTTSYAQVDDYPFKTIVGDPVPSFDMLNLSGHKFNIEDLKGKVVVINLFASWCPPCIKEMPLLDTQLAKKYSQEDLLILAIGYDHVKLEMEYFKEDHDYDFVYIPDFGKKIFNLFADKTIPRNIVLDASGQIIFQSIGYFPDKIDQLITLVEDEIASQ